MLDMIMIMEKPAKEWLELYNDNILYIPEYDSWRKYKNQELDVPLMKIPYFEEGDELADGYKFLNKPTQLLEKMEKEELN